MTAVLGLALAACSTAKTVASGPKLKVTAPSSVQGNVVDLELVATGISIVKADGDTSGKTGHFHVFIDREPVAPGAAIPKEPGIVHSAANPVTLTGLSIGRHKIAVVFGDGAHRRISSTVSETSVDVKGPSVDAAAPATAAAAKPFVLNVTVAGVTLVKADGDTSGKTGHLHVFIDREPNPAGQAIPKEAGIIHTADTTITMPALAAGEHTIWVVLGNGVHAPFASPVLDKVTVTVA
jgi:uncharacterized protein DUF4399